MLRDAAADIAEYGMLTQVKINTSTKKVMSAYAFLPAWVAMGNAVNARTLIIAMGIADQSSQGR